MQKQKLTLKTTNKNCADVHKKYCRVTLTDESVSKYRFVETSDGYLEYRQGTGNGENVSARTFRTLVRTIIRTAQAHQITHLAIAANSLSFPGLVDKGDAWLYSTVAENMYLSAYEFQHYKTNTKDTTILTEVLLCGKISTAGKNGLDRGIVVGKSANMTRDIANTSAAEMTPSELAKTSVQALKGTSAKVKIINEAELKRLKMGLLLAVGGGTEIETKMIVIEYWGEGKPSQKQSKSTKSKQPTILLGKGITYDTGGLNVKPSGHMHDMHLDMSGGAAVLGAMQAIATLKLRKNVIGIIPAAENAVSDKAMRAGDIITAMNGSTVEVVHTDAEGRMVLADALTYSERYNPKQVIDVATLTGSSLAALGQHASAVMSTDLPLQNRICELGELSGDYVWPLPLWDEYDQHIKSVRADIANIAPSFSRFGGAIEGGVFLKHFVPKGASWAHIDMAPRMEAVPSDKLCKGATGEPVRLLVQMIENT